MSRGWLRLLTFAAAYAVLHLGCRTLRGSAWEPWVTHTFTAAPAAALIDWTMPADGVAAIGAQLAWAGGRLTLYAGCDGLDVMSLFAAAVLSSDVSGRRGIALLTGGLLLAWCLNQTRIVALYWTFRHARDGFDAVHTVWGPLLLVAAMLAIFRWGTAGRPPAAAA